MQVNMKLKLVSMDCKVLMKNVHESKNIDDSDPVLFECLGPEKMHICI